jgi:hypothetical protein
MTTDETTHLLARTAADQVGGPEGWGGTTTKTAQTGKKFALWQLGALCGKQ